MKTTFAIFAAIVIIGISYTVWSRASHTAVTDPRITMADSVLAGVLVPDVLSQNAQFGKLGYEAKCADCHGVNAAGRDGKAPPLVHIIYEPNHHGDDSFQRAAAMGVRSHHWPFGDMPPVEGISRADVMMIITYIRELQRANGIG